MWPDIFWPFLSGSSRLIMSPGVFEIPITISKNIKKYDAFIALGCVIKGETPHFDFISQASLSKSVYIALKKRPIDTETAEKFISKISRALEELGQSEISTNTIGTMVMEGLKELDPLF